MPGTAGGLPAARPDRRRLARTADGCPPAQSRKGTRTAGGGPGSLGLSRAAERRTFASPTAGPTGSTSEPGGRSADVPRRDRTIKRFGQSRDHRTVLLQLTDQRIDHLLALRAANYVGLPHQRSGKLVDEVHLTTRILEDPQFIRP